MNLFLVILFDFVGSEKFSSASGLALMCLGLFNGPLPMVFGKVLFFSFTCMTLGFWHL